MGACHFAAKPLHRGLAELYRLGLLKTVITQNIDGLHQKGGMPDQAVIELHGNNMRVRCMSCDRISANEIHFNTRTEKFFARGNVQVQMNREDPACGGSS